MAPVTMAARRWSRGPVDAAALELLGAAAAGEVAPLRGRRVAENPASHWWLAHLSRMAPPDGPCAGGRGPVDGAVLEVLEAAAVAQAADLVPVGIAQGALSRTAWAFQTSQMAPVTMTCAPLAEDQ